MEQALVFVVPSAQAKGDLQIAYTSRRFSEAKELITRDSSVQGLTYLDSQVKVTKQAILATRDPVVKRQLTQKYVASLRDVSTQLEEQKQIAVATAPRGAPDAYVPPPTATPTPELTPTPASTRIAESTRGGPTPTPTQTRKPTREPTPTPYFPPPTIPPVNVGDSISQTQKNIEDAIEELEDESDDGPGNSDFGQGQGQGQGQDKKD